MGEKSVSRSVLRSKRLIQKATLELMKEKDSAKITVTDIMLSSTAVPERVRNSVMFEMRVCFFADGIVGMYKRWFKGDLHGSLNDITTQVSRNVAGNSKDLLVEGKPQQICP